MKRKALVLLMALLLACSAFAASIDVTRSVVNLGFTPDVRDNPDGTLRCDYNSLSGSKATMEWTDAGRVFSVTGNPKLLAQAYVDALRQEKWKSCSYLVSGKAKVTFGAASRNEAPTIAEYQTLLESALGVSTGGAPKAAATPAPTKKPNKAENKTHQVKTQTKVSTPAKASTSTSHYVLNTKAKKFHRPDCYAINQMNPENRDDYYGSYGDIYASGYSPCQKCNP